MKLPIRFVLGLVALLTIALFLSSASAATAGPHFGPWSALEPVAILNSNVTNELMCSISHDGLRLYIQRAPGDIWVSHRESTKADWEEPVALQDPINTSAVEAQAFESIDGHWLYFGSTRSGGLGGMDIWVSWRKDKHDDTAWETPVNISALNSPGFENAPMLFFDESTGTTQMYFGSARGVGPRGLQPYADVYMSTLGPNGFDVPAAVTELNVADYLDGKPWVRRDGLEIFFVSYRDGAGPMVTGTIYSATRESTGDPWSEEFIAIDRSATGQPGDTWITTPVLSWDAQTLYVGVNQVGSDFGDIYVAHREKIRGPKNIPLLIKNY